MAENNNRDIVGDGNSNVSIPVDAYAPTSEASSADTDAATHISNTEQTAVSGTANNGGTLQTSNDAENNGGQQSSVVDQSRQTGRAEQHAHVAGSTGYTGYQLTPTTNATGTVDAASDYEGTLIGLLMTKPDPRLYDVQEILPSPSFFADPIHRTTYSILLKLMKADAIPGSLPLFAEALYTNSHDPKSADRRKFATKEDALRYINSVTHPNAYTTSTAHIDYAKFIRWEADKRELAGIIDDVRGRLSTVPFEDREEFTSDVEERVASISTRIHDRAGLHHISESTQATRDVINLLHSGQLLAASVKTGIHALDRRIGGFNPGEVIVLAGRPGAGKTALAFQIALNVAQGHVADTKETIEPKSVFLFNLEMMESQIMDRFASNLARVSLDVFKKEYEKLTNGEYSGRLRDLVQDRLRRQYDRVNIALDYIDTLPIELTAQSGLNPTIIKSMIQQKKREIGRAGAPELGLVVIDYLQLLTPSSRQQSRENEVADTSKRIKQMAKECDVPILLLSQLNRDANTDEMPDLKNLRESGSIEQDADKVIFIWNENAKKTKDDYRTQTSDERAQQAMWNKERMREKITVAKNRQGESGTVDVVFDWSYQTFTSQLGSYESGGESFDDFFNKYYRKTRSGDDLFWPLTDEKMPTGMLAYRHSDEPEMPYLLQDNTLYSSQNNGKSAMRVVDKPGRYDDIDTGFSSFDDDYFDYDDIEFDDAYIDNSVDKNSGNIASGRSGVSGIDMADDYGDDGVSNEDAYAGDELGDDKTENRIGSYGKPCPDEAEDATPLEQNTGDGSEERITDTDAEQHDSIDNAGDKANQTITGDNDAKKQKKKPSTKKQLSALDKMIQELENG